MGHTQDSTDGAKLCQKRRFSRKSQKKLMSPKRVFSIIHCTKTKMKRKKFGGVVAVGLGIFSQKWPVISIFSDFQLAARKRWQKLEG